MITELQNIGLTQEEAKVYLSTLEIGGGPVSVIAKQAGIHRVSCYHTIENLIKKRFLSQHTKNGIRYFFPEPPEQIQKLAEEKLNTVKGLVPQLLSLVNTSGFKPKIRFYEGRDGIERVAKESLEAKEEVLRFSNLQKVFEFSSEFFQNTLTEKMKKGIKTRYLSPNTIETVQILKEYLPENYDPNLLEVLLVNKDQFLFENDIIIFGNTVAILSLEKHEYLGLIVESPSFAKTMKAVFDLAWLGATAFVAK